MSRKLIKSERNISLKSIGSAKHVVAVEAGGVLTGKMAVKVEWGLFEFSRNLLLRATLHYTLSSGIVDEQKRW